MDHSRPGWAAIWAAGPENRIAPLSMMYARSATATATFTDCSTSRIAVPLARMSRTDSRSCSTTMGASPSDSSSISSSRGLVIIAMASASICCWPPDRFRARTARCSARAGNDARASAISCASLPPARRPGQAAARRFSATLSVGKMPSPPGTCAMPSRAISSGGTWVMSCPSKTTAPPLASTTPPMARSSVDLPAPFAPSSATISPSAISMAASWRTMTPS